MLTFRDAPRRIVVVGHDLEICGLVGSILTSAEYLTNVVRHPGLAIKAAQEVHVDAVLVAILPRYEATAWWALERIAGDPVTREIPLMTLAEIDSLASDRRRFLKDHHIRLIRLPLDSRDLLTEVERWLRRARDGRMVKELSVSSHDDAASGSDVLQFLRGNEGGRRTRSQ